MRCTGSPVRQQILPAGRFAAAFSLSPESPRPPAEMLQEAAEVCDLFLGDKAFAGAEQQAENQKDVQEGLLYVCPGRLPAVSFFLLLVLDQALLL